MSVRSESVIIWIQPTAGSNELLYFTREWMCATDTLTTSPQHNTMNDFIENIIHLTMTQSFTTDGCMMMMNKWGLINDRIFPLNRQYVIMSA